MRIIVSGDEGFDDYRLLKAKLGAFTLPLSDVIVLMTGSRKKEITVWDKKKMVGAEHFAEKWACNWYYTMRIYHDYAKTKPDLNMYKEADAAVVFWDGENKRTKEIIRNCKKHKLKLKVVRYASED